MNRRERLMHGPKEEKRVKEKRKLRPDLLEKQKDGELRPSHQRIIPIEEHKGALLPMTRSSVRSELSCALSGMPLSQKKLCHWKIPKKIFRCVGLDILFS